MNSLFSMARYHKAEPRPPATPLPWSNGEAKTGLRKKSGYFIRIRAPRLPLRSFFKKREQLLKTLERPPIMNGGHYLTRGHIISVLLYRKTNLMSTKKIALPGGRLAHKKIVLPNGPSAHPDSCRRVPECLFFATGVGPIPVFLPHLLPDPSPPRPPQSRCRKGFQRPAAAYPIDSVTLLLAFRTVRPRRFPKAASRPAWLVWRLQMRPAEDFRPVAVRTEAAILGLDIAVWRC